MQTVAIYLTVPLLCALVSLALRLPPLVGFLVAGYVIHALHTPHLDQLEVAAQVGVTLLLFGVGLKLDLRQLLRREVWLVSSAHMAVSIVIATSFIGLGSLVGVGLLAGADLRTMLLLGFALSFSSTVFVVKVLEDRSDRNSLYGRVAVGILVIQDIAAVAFIAWTNDTPPTWRPVCLLLLYPAAKVFRWAWSHIEQQEMHALFGLVMALVPGYAFFEWAGVGGDVGALIMGILLASHPSAGPLARSLFSIKELLLVAFFLSIGLIGLPTLEQTLLGLGLLLLLPLQALSYIWMLHWHRLRARTAILAGLVLANNSEFALIVASVGVAKGLLTESWLTVLAVAVAGSFVTATLVNRDPAHLADRIAHRLPQRDPATLHPHDRPIEIGDAEAVVLGMGRVGTAAYVQLRDEHGLDVCGVEQVEERVERLLDQGYNVVEGDATDEDFWDRLSQTGGVKVAVLAMPFHGHNMIALERLTASEFEGAVAAIAHYDREAEEMRAAGVDTVLQMYAGAGGALADKAVKAEARSRRVD